MKRKLVIAHLISVVIVCLLSFGNPQWTRAVYMWQWQVLDQKARRPKKYNGVWRAWDKNGNMTYQSHYVNGRKVGLSTRYFKSGNIYTHTFYKNGRANGAKIQFFENGIIKMIRDDRNNKSVGFEMQFYIDGRLSLIRRYNPLGGSAPIRIFYKYDLQENSVESKYVIDLRNQYRSEIQLQIDNLKKHFSQNDLDLKIPKIFD